MSDAKPPLPAERWKGPPEGPPDYTGSFKGGCSTPAMVIVGSLLTLLGLWPLIRVLAAPNWNIGPDFWLFALGCLAGSAGINLVRRAKRNASHSEQAKALEPTQSEPNGCFTLLMILAGAFLLLPGLCSFAFGLLSLGFPGSNDSRDFLDPLLIGLIWAALARPPAKAGLMMLAGLVLLVPGAYFVAFGASRVYSVGSSVLFLLYLPFGIVLLASAWRRHRLGGQPTP